MNLKCFFDFHKIETEILEIDWSTRPSQWSLMRNHVASMHPLSFYHNHKRWINYYISQYRCTRCNKIAIYRTCYNLLECAPRHRKGTPWTEPAGSFPCTCEIHLTPDEISALKMKRALDCSLIGEDLGGDDEYLRE
jgi:hypothetical protein